MQTDSITQAITDSLNALKADSVARMDSIVRADSLARIDSVRMADSLQLAAHRNSGFPGIAHPSTVHNEIWVVVLMLLFFLLLVFSIARSGSLIPETIKNFFQLKERSSIFSKATVNDAKIRFSIRVFSIGVISLFCYTYFNGENASVSLLRFGYFAVATYGFFWLKNVLFDLLGYVFLDVASIRLAKESYFNILSLIGICFFPLLLIQFYNPYNITPIIHTTALILCIVGYLLIVFRLFQIFLHKILASFYILLYLCTLEFLPLVGLFFVYYLIK